jgi:DNA processing protein
MRNALMAALTNATVIIEASETSGTRIQARSALAEGRQVLLLAPVMERAWARELATRPGVTVVSTPGEVSEALARPVPDGSAP